MFVKIDNTPRAYPWGSRDGIAEFRGTTPSGEPEAELWLGAHAGSPARIVGGGSHTPPFDDIASWIEAEPAQALGDHLAARRGRLPFLLKILAADSALSLQAHPTTERARLGFALEEAAGIAIDAPTRNYKDDSAKPEVIVAVSETFEALSGFRALHEVLGMIDVLRAADSAAAVGAGTGAPSIDFLQSLLGESEPVRATVECLLDPQRTEAVAELIDRVSVLAASVQAAASPFAASFETATVLAGAYPGDPGIVISLLLNRVTLRRGEALFLDAGNVHAYLRGVGIELMSASDNVLRGGLTAKHVDVHELVDVLDFTPIAPPYLRLQAMTSGVETFDAGVEDFVLHHVHAPAALEVSGPAIALVEMASVRIQGRANAVDLARGESVFVTPDEGLLSITGDGSFWIASVPPQGDRMGQASGTAAK